MFFRRVADKLDKSKKLRLSLDKFVPKNKQVSISVSISQWFMYINIIK